LTSKDIAYIQWDIVIYILRSSNWFRYMGVLTRPRYWMKVYPLSISEISTSPRSLLPVPFLLCCKLYQPIIQSFSFHIKYFFNRSISLIINIKFINAGVLQNNKTSVLVTWLGINETDSLKTVQLLRLIAFNNFEWGFSFQDTEWSSNQTLLISFIIKSWIGLYV